MFVNVLLFFDVGRRVQSQGLIQFRLQRRPSIHIISHDSPPVPSLRDQEEKPPPPALEPPPSRLFSCLEFVRSLHCLAQCRAYSWGRTPVR